MNNMRNLGKQAAMIGVCFVCFLSTIPASCQSGPPPIPILSLQTFSWGQTNLNSDYGNYAPISDSNAFIIPFWDANALWLDTTNIVPAFVHYHVIETNGFVNIDLAAGTIFIQVVPDWASADTNQFGLGPGARGYILACGDFSTGSPDGLWAIYVDAGGTNIYFGGVSNSVTNIYVSAPISWATNTLHEIGVYYNTNTELFLDGQWAATGGPVNIVPETNTWTNGFFMGSDDLGFEQIRGIVPYVELDTTNMYIYDTNYLTIWWDWDTNSYYTWLDGDGGGGGFHPDGGGFHPPPNPTNTFNSNYVAYTNFWLLITNIEGEAQVTLINACRGLTYVILTNSQVEPMTSPNWQPWVTLVGSNTVMLAGSLPPASNTVYFNAELVLETGTNGLPDWWQMEYFKTLNVNPYADPDGDLLCNLDEYNLGLNPTNAHTLSSVHTDAQAQVLAYTDSTGCVYHLAITNGSDTNTLLLTISPTLVGTNYQIYSRIMTNGLGVGGTNIPGPTTTNGPWIVETNFLGTNTSTTVAVCLNGRVLSLVGGYGEDSDGDGLPDGYEVLVTLTDPYLPDTGLTGTPDGYKDPDGDGYVNLAEYYNQTDPHVFNTPAGPINVVIDPGTTSNTYTISWQPAGGPVIGYVILVYDSGNWVPLATNSANSLSYALSQGGSFLVEAIYAGGISFASQPSSGAHQAATQAALVHGPGGKTYLLVSATTTNVAGYNLNLEVESVTYPETYAYFAPIGYYFNFGGSTNYTGSWYQPYAYTNLYVPVAQFTNGVALMTDAQCPPYENNEAIWVQPVLSDGDPGVATYFGEQNFYYDSSWSVPFLDGTTQMKQNIRFLLRIAGGTPFGYTLSSVDNTGSTNDFNGEWYALTYPSNYVYSSFFFTVPGEGSINGWPAYWSYGRPYSFSDYPAIYWNHFQPFEDNYFYLNFVFNSELVNANGYLQTGFLPWEQDNYPPGFGFTWAQFSESTNMLFHFPTYNYVAESNQAPIPGLLSLAATPWVGNFSAYAFSASDPGNFGTYNSSGQLAMTNNAVNFYGLAIQSLELTFSNAGGIYFDTLSPGNTVTNYNGLPRYLGTAEPNLETVGYYFAQPATDPIPGLESSFASTNTTPSLMLGSVGNSMLIAGYAKQAVSNGYTNVFAYLGQYFTNAFIMSNGVVTTNQTGILSEYGEFFPTVPGQVALFTKPDPDQTNIQGQCTIDIIRLSLDVNHDGIMDESFTGPDNTGPNAPFVFWLNNDYDRWVGTNEEDIQTAAQPDFNYTNGGNRAIPCPRDLEDYARLWVSGVSNTLASLPEGSTVTLNWGDIGNPNPANPSIDIFQAADTNGGTAYLTNISVASNQIDTNLFVGRLGPGGSLQLNTSTFSNNWAGDHYIFCGSQYGSGQLNLTVADSNGNVLAQSSQSIQIVDIKQMYERWTVGDDPSTPPGAPMAAAQYVNDGQPVPGQPPFHYSYDNAYDTNDDYIVFVHGWNMPIWEKDRFAETSYKRLYWQGYKGRFGSLRWPCNLFNQAAILALNFAQYNIGERTAWQCGQPFERLLTSLNGYYPGHVYVLAHSMGNVVTGEALRLAGTNAIVNTYVATQAAVSARAYDNTIPQDVTYTPLRPDSEGHYYVSTAPPYFNGIGGAFNFVDYYNAVDYALHYWVLNQSLKPNSTSYFYTTPTLQFPSGYYYAPPFRAARSLNFPTNRYEIFAMAAQSYSFALGAETNIANTFTHLPPANLQAPPYNFSNQRTGHSFEFYSDNMTVGAYWQQLLSSFSITP